MSKRKRKAAVPLYRTHDISRTAFAPDTPAGKTALEARGGGGPFRPGKTAQDWVKPDARPRVAAWQSRLAKAQAA